jgi:hypothetical protein
MIGFLDVPVFLGTGTTNRCLIERKIKIESVLTIWIGIDYFGLGLD